MFASAVVVALALSPVEPSLSKSAPPPAHIKRHRALVSVAPSSAGPPSSKLPLLVLSVVPVAFGSYATAVQLLGTLSDAQAVMLQCGTYAVAGAAVNCMRQGRNRHASDRGRALSMSGSTWRAGAELGLWIFCGATLQSLGLQRTTAARAGFLVRLSTVLVPLAECVLRSKLPSPLLSSAVLSSVLGVGLMVISPGAGLSGARAATALGDGLVALSALFYSIHILRLGVLAPRHDAWALATSKSSTQLLSSLATLAALLLSSGGVRAARLPSIPSRFWQTILFTGTVTCAFPMWAQSYGQQLVRPSHASLIYAMAPVWNAIIAALVLGQYLTPLGCLGSVFMMLGMVLSIIASRKECNE
jgi:drug/metabolite transporter (DMT)-like permease